MSYYPKGHHDTGDEVDDFDEYDPTPYGGGYDIALTYGRPLSPSDETCYPSSCASLDYDYDSQRFTSYAQPSAYCDDALDNEYKSYARRPSRPAPSPPQPGESEYGSGYGRKPEYGGSGYDGPKPGMYRPGGESEYGGSGYDGPRPGMGGYGGESEYGRKPEYGRPDSEFGSGYGHGGEYGSGRKPEYEESGYGRKPDGEEYGSGGYGRKSGYGEDEGYGQGQAEYQRPSYGRSEEEDYRKPSYERRDDDDEEGYGRKKYGDDSDDDEEKRHRHHHHHHHFHHHHKQHSDDDE